MKNQQYTVGERNRYFYGKLMTARDFEDEQRYSNDKRRLGNRLLHGAGIASGLGVILMDNQTISLEAGMALDYLGREIVVRDPAVKRISAIPGFEQIRENCDAYLCIAYGETLKEATFSASGLGNDGEAAQEYNRIAEGYELFWRLEKPDPYHLDLSGLLFQTLLVYEGEGIRITVRIPRIVNTGTPFQAKVLFEKRDVSAPVRFTFRLSSNLFSGAQGENFVVVSYMETEVSTYQQVELEYQMNCGSFEDDYANITVPVDSFQMTIGGEIGERLAAQVRGAVEVTNRPLREVALDAYYAQNFDEITTPKEDQLIYLAKAHMIVSQSVCFVDKLEKNPFRQLLPGNDLLQLLQSLERPTTATGASSAPVKQEIAPALPQRSQQVLSGSEVINFGGVLRAGKCYYSHEFIHGLGVGPVAVVLSTEFGKSGSGNTLVFGNGSIFPPNEFSLAPPAVEMAAMVNTQKGTLQIGVRLLEKTNQRVIRVHWWAFPATDEQQPENEGLAESLVRVRIEPNTANLEPLQQLRLTASIDGSGSQDVNWSVVEKSGGSVDRNGLYTAPAEEGVFEIQAESTRFPGHRASAYVVIGKL